MSEPLCVIVTGLSGAGKSIAIDSFEDFGFFCVDNLPIALIPKLMDLCKSTGGRFEKLALGLDTRVWEQLSQFYEAIGYIKTAGYRYSILFLEATDDVLIRRFSTSRRKHPIGGKHTIREQIHQEREKLGVLKGKSDFTIDTSSLSPQILKNLIAQKYLDEGKSHTMLLTLTTFGYKNGIPLDSDLVFDVRFLPNPFHEPDLRTMTGDDEKVIEYLNKFPLTEKFLQELYKFIDFLYPCYLDEGKSYLNISIGCTGGKHRSVFIANKIKSYMEKNGSEVRLVNRDIGKE